MTESPLIDNDKLFQSETGTVVKITPLGKAVVRLSRTKACEFCGQCSVSKEDGMMELTADVPEGESIRAGDTVKISKKPKVQTRAILLLLITPLIGLLLGVGIGYLLFAPKEPLMALTALLGLILAFITSTILIRMKKWHKGAGLTVKKLSTLILISALILCSCKKSPAVQPLRAEPDAEYTNPMPVLPNEEFMNQKQIFCEYIPVPDSVLERMKGKSFPNNCEIDRRELEYLKVKYYGFDGEIHIGELVLNEKVANKVAWIFVELFQSQYQIEKIKLIDEYDANDDASMTDNNTSAFCYRTIAGRKKLSKHALGLAIDINPLYNPCVTYNEDGSIKKVEPEAGRPYIERDASDPRRITKDSEIYKLFIENGFIWGGDWNSLKDYQHFEYSLE